MRHIFLKTSGALTNDRTVGIGAMFGGGDPNEQYKRIFF